MAKQTYLATIQVVFESDDEHGPEEDFVQATREIPGFVTFRFYGPAPDYGYWMPYVYDWSRFFSETAIQDESQAPAAEDMALFVLEGIVNEDGDLVPCIAVRGEEGFHRTNWAWGKDKALAERLCEEYNLKRHISRQEAIRIIASTMKRP